MSLIFHHYYHDVLCEDLILKDKISNTHQIPSIISVFLSHSSRLIVKNSQFAIPALSGFEFICGQKAKITKAKKSVSAFQTRTNQPIGCKVTLRKAALFSFLEKLVFILMPRLNVLKYHEVCSRAYNVGMEQILLFPEIEGHYDFFDSLKGCHLHITTSAISIESCQLLLTGLKIATKGMSIDSNS